MSKKIRFQSQRQEEFSKLLLSLCQSKNLYSQPQTPSGRVFFRHAALNFLAIHKVFRRKFALPDGKIPRPAGILGCEYRF